MTRPREVTTIHTRLLRCALEVDEARAYWVHAAGGEAVDSRRAFDEYWFGARSLPRIEVLLANMRARFDAFPPSVAVLGTWPNMPPDVRRLVCHWHLQLADPLYRAFTGEYLAQRRQGMRPTVTRDLVVRWVGDLAADDRWTISTRIQFASKLLSAAFSAGLVAANRDPRPLETPRVADEALEYLLYLLRDVEFAGTLLENPYLSSVGLSGRMLEARLRTLPALAFSRQADLVDFGWRYNNLAAWAEARVAGRDLRLIGATR